MTTPNQYPSEERLVAKNQHFQGEVIPEYNKAAGEQAVIEMLRAPIGRGDSLVVSPDAEAPRLGKYDDAPIVAKLELGGQGNGRPETAFVARIDGPDKMSRRLASYLRNAVSDTDFRDGKPLYMVGVGGGATTSGFAIVRPTTHTAFYGRHKNNMSWFDAAGNPYDNDPETEVIHDKEVSRQQLMLSYDKTGGLRISGETNNSDTVVITVATEEHKEVIEKARAAKEAETDQAAKKALAKGRIAGLLSGKR